MKLKLIGFQNKYSLGMASKKYLLTGIYGHMITCMTYDHIDILTIILTSQDIR